MEVAAIIALVNGLLGIAYRLWDAADQIKGSTPIPSWDEISDKNKLLQAKIDAEKV